MEGDIDGALLFLETLCKYFQDDNLEYDYNTYEGWHCGIKALKFKQTEVIFTTTETTMTTGRTGATADVTR